MLLHFFALFLAINCNPFTSAYEKFAAKSSNHPHSRIKDAILTDYDPTIRPVVNHKNATNVAMRMLLISLDYDEFTNSINVHTWLRMNWTDEHLKWNKKDYDNVEKIYLHSTEIWTPDLSIYNSHDQSNDPSVLNGVTCSISNVGVVKCVSPVKIAAYCKAKLLRYPYDVQNCTITLGSWVHNSEEINVTLPSGPILIDNYAKNVEWKLLNASASRHHDRKCCRNITYPTLKYTFTIKRLPGFHAATIVVPALVIMMMSLLTLCLRPTDMDRFCLVCCSLIVHLLHLQYISWSLPNFGDDVPLIILYGRNSFLLSALCLLLTIGLKRLVRQPEESPMWISKTMTGLLGSRVGQIILLFDYSLKGAALVKGEEEGTNIIENNGNSKARNCLLFAKVLDRVCFLAFLIGYFCMFIVFIPEE